MSHTICVAAPARASENMRIRNECGREAERDLSQLPVHFFQVCPGRLRTPPIEVGRLETEAKEETFERQRGRLAGERATSESWKAGRADAFRCNLSQDIFFLSGAPWQR